MNRTPPLNLLLVAVLGGVVMWFVETALAASGAPVLIPPITVGVALFLIGAILVVMALPVRRVARRVPRATVDPFYATRVVMLAKASSLGGALLSGGAIAVVGYLLSRSVIPSMGAVTMSAITAAGAILLMIAGLVAEHMCAIPPDDDDRSSEPPTEGLS